MDLAVNNRPKRNEPENLESELQQEKLTVSKHTGKIIEISEPSGKEDDDVSPHKSRNSDSEGQVSESSKVVQKKRKSEISKKSKPSTLKIKKPRKKVVSSSEEESSDESSSDESVTPGFAVGEFGISALENLSTAESDLMDELTSMIFIICRR